VLDRASGEEVFDGAADAVVAVGGAHPRGGISDGPKGL
jgi:hypothetical protein